MCACVLVCFALSCFIGSQPAQYMIDNPDSFGGNNSDQSIDYVFSCLCGIFFTSTLYYLIYAAVKQNKPQVFPELILPAFISGVMWAIADVSWFIANGALKFVVAFPVITTGPGIVAALWGIFYLNEIKGKRNYFFLALAFTISASGIACIIVST